MEAKETLLRDAAAMESIIMRLVWLERKRFAQELATCGLTVPQFLTLTHIERLGSPCPMGELAAQMHQSSATMTGIIERLVKMGLVARQSSPHDRRLVLVGLTEAGRATLEQAHRARRERMCGSLARMGEGDRREFIRLLRAYLAASEAGEQGP
ncbi:MAG TPA: MarR family transcriptional regulator [Anaerolineae bacterium]|nr:MarR family transcriptional regulator [Anaerolineae bacterium]